MIRTKTKIIRDTYDYEAVKRALRRAEAVSIDVETSGVKPEDGLNPWTGYLVGVGIGYKVRGDEALYGAYLPMVVKNPDPYGGTIFTATDLRGLCEAVPEKAVWLMHNAKFDLKWLERETGFRWKADTLRDPMVEMWMYRVEEPKDLKSLTKKFYPEREAPITFNDLLGRGKAKKKLEEVALGDIAMYCMADAINTLLIAQKLRAHILDESPIVWDVYRKLEMPMLRLLTDMELRGVQVDIKALTAMAERLYVKQKDIETNLKAVADINWNSNMQVIEVLQDLGVVLPNVKTAKGKQKLDREILLSIEDQHPCISDLLDGKEVNKLISTYIEGFFDKMDTDGRIHADFGQTVARTGRLSCRAPNLQNIPSDSFKKKGSRLRSEYQMLRRLFVGNPGLICVDLSQIEMRVAAHFSEDPALLDIYKNDKDIHDYTATHVTGGDRTLAKNVNFGAIYLQAAKGLSDITGMPLDAAKVYAANFRKTYRGFFMWADRVQAHAHANGYVETILGRRRYLPDIRSEDWFLRSAAGRQAVNTVIQGSAADYLKVAMLNIEKEIHKYGFHTVLQVHDELMFAPFREVSTVDVSKAMDLIQHHMENALTLKIPVKAEPKFVKSWADAK